MRYGGLLFMGHKDSLLPVINMKYLEHLPHDTYRISHYNERLFLQIFEMPDERPLILFLRYWGRK